MCVILYYTQNIVYNIVQLYVCGQYGHSHVSCTVTDVAAHEGRIPTGD